MTPKIEILGQNFAHFDRFESSFLTIFGFKKVIFSTFSELFRSCLGSVWALFSALKDQGLGVFSDIKTPLGSREALINFEKACQKLPQNHAITLTKKFQNCNIIPIKILKLTINDDILSTKK